MIELYAYRLEDYNGGLVILESTIKVDEQISENEFIARSNFFDDRVYETNKVFVNLENEKYGYYEEMCVWVYHKEKQGINRIAQQLKSYLLDELEKERIKIDTAYKKLIDDYSNMAIEKIEY